VLARDDRAELFERCGFQRDVVLREAMYVDGAYHDVELYCLLKTDMGPHDE
jgi:RimJ/RimL family protein N-acetyltransferase